LPRLQERGRKAVFRTERILVAGLPESSVEEKIGHIYSGVKNPQTSLLASGGQVEIRLTARGESPEEAGRLLDEMKASIRDTLGYHIFSENGERLEEVVGRLLSQTNRTISIAESCTGGLITHRMTEVAGSSRYFERGYVTYSNESKVELLGVPEKLIAEAGAVSEDVALAMARGVRQASGTDLGLAVTGIAGPGGGTSEKPVGLVYAALSDGQTDEAHRYMLPGNRSHVKTWTAQLALNLLRLRLLSM
jgi:nicotinamide-nucleotide amidase